MPRKRANTVSLKLDNKAHDDQAAFLVNVENKIQFIEELANWLEEDDHSFTCCDRDADTTIVSTALCLARNKHSVEVVSDDTDILILLMGRYV